MLVSGWAGRLNDENIVAPDVFLDPHVSLAIGKRADCCLTKWHTDVFANALGQLAIGGAAENLQFRLKCKHGAANLGARKRPWQSSKLANGHFFGELLPPRRPRRPESQVRDRASIARRREA